MSTTIAPAGAAPITPAPQAAVPAVLQPEPAVSGGGPTADLQQALEALWGALGALKGALQALQGAQMVDGGGPSSGCSCGQASAGAGALGAPVQTSDPLPVAPPLPATSPGDDQGAHAGHAHQSGGATSDWKAPDGFKIQYPVKGARVSSHFGHVSSIRNNRPHTGIDLAIGSGTRINAAAPGKVVDVGFESGGLGNYVAIDHGNGIITKYGHMLEKPSVKEGQPVNAGDQIGKVGSTGNSTGPHLHFMVVKNGNNQDPAPYLSGDKRF